MDDMQTSFGQSTLSAYKCTSHQELLDRISHCEAGFLCLGEGSRQRRGFYSVEFRLGFSGTRRFGIGIISEGHGLAPHLLLLPHKDLLLAGFNQEVVGVGLEQKRAAFHMHLDSLFRSFLHLYEEKL